MKLLGLLLSAVVAVGCSGCAVKGHLNTGSMIPAFNSTIMLHTENSAGSGCVVDSNQALTAFHVTHGLSELKWRNLAHEGGVVRVVRADEKADLALVASETPFNTPASPIAEKDPKVGEEVWVIGVFKWIPTAYHARVVALDPESGDLVLDGMGFPGSSGGCVVNLKGELLAIFTSASSIGSIPEQRPWTNATPVWGFKFVPYPVPE